MIRKLWRQIAFRDLVSPWTFWITTVICTVLVFVYEIPKNGGSVWLWMAANVIGQLALGLFMVLGKITFRRFFENLNRAALLNLLIMLTAALARGLVFGLVSTSWELGVDTPLSFRVAGALTLGFGFTIGCGVALSERSRHARIVSESIEKRRQLARLFEQTESSGAEIDNDLRAKALEVLLPQLDKLRDLLKTLPSKNLKSQLIAEFQDVLTSKVQPLTRELFNYAKKIDEMRNMNTNQRLPLWPRQIFLRESFNDKFIFLITLPTVFVAFSTTMGFVWAAVALFFWALSWGLSLVLKRLLPKELRVNSIVAIVVAGIVTLAAMTPYLLFTEYILPSPSQRQAFGLTAALTIPVVAMLLAYSSGIRQNRQWLEVELEEFNQRFERLISVHRQKVWLSRKHWVYLVHGTVQASLTAVLLELSRAKELSKNLISRINEILESISSQIQVSVGQTLELQSAIEDITNTWTTCEVSIEPDPEVLALAKKNQTLTQVLNEICKEIVSNAMRHGAAKRISIRILLENQQVKVESENDGSQPKLKSSSGLGAALYDNLCLSWSLTRDANSKRTRFESIVAIE